MHILARTLHSIYSLKLTQDIINQSTSGHYQSIDIFLSLSEVTRKSVEQNIQISIADCHYMYSSIDGNTHDV
jgi:hypothetical protein